MKMKINSVMFSGSALKGEAGGVALILVVWVMVILIAIVGEFSSSMRTEINITRNFKEEEGAYQLALAGIEQAKIEILAVKEPAVMYINEESILIFDEEAEEPDRDESLGKGSFKYTITDEDAKININTATVDRLKNLFMDSGVDITEVDTIVDSIMDWRDINSLHRLNGAEEDYYSSLEKPYSCKDGPFDVIEELLLVKGITRDILYGSEDEDEENVYEGVAKYLTVYGSGNININTAQAVVLETNFSAVQADNIINQREEGPISTPVANGKVSSSFFTIISTGSNADGTIKRSVKAIIQKKKKNLETLYWNDNIIG